MKSNGYDVMRVKLTFVDEILGTCSGNTEIHREYIASKAPDAKSREEEIEAIGVQAEIEKTMTVFPRSKEGEPIFWNYQVKGFMKSACSALRTIKGTKSKDLKAYKKHIDLNIFVFADAEHKEKREIVIHTDESIDECQRPLRASTPQGERVALANSESIAPGAWVEFDILLMEPADRPLVEEWLDYGLLNGLGQWRNSGKGAFTWEYAE